MNNRIADCPPTHEQLKRLASVGFGEAVQRGSLKQVGRTHYFADETQFTTALNQENTLKDMRRGLTMRIDAQPTEQKTWNLKLTDIVKVESSSGLWISEHTEYSFAWSRTRVHMAHRAIKILGLPSMAPESMKDYLEQSFRRDDIIEFLAMENNMSEVTEGDCEDIIQLVSDYFHQSDI